MSVIIVLICYSLIAFQFGQLRKVRALYVQNILLAQIKAAANPQNLMDSRVDPANLKLQSCLSGIDGAVCSSADRYYFRLLDSGTAVSGTDIAPVGFDMEARQCALGAGNSGCIFTLKTSFRVQCKELPANPYVIPPTCPASVPGIIQVFYEFDTIADLSANRVLGIKPVMGSIIVKL